MSDEIAIPDKMPLDEYAELISSHKKAIENEKFWREVKEDLARKIEAILGEVEVGLVNDHEAVTYAYVDKMRTADLKKNEPELYQAYVKEVTKTEFDVKLFKMARPDKYHEYQSRALINKFSV